MIEHCPTEEMLGDHFTKPLQGALFRKFRAEIMNIPDDLDMGEMGMDGTGLKKGITCKLHNKTDPGCPQECVGGCGKSGSENGVMECPDIRTRKAFIFTCNINYSLACITLSLSQLSWTRPV